MRFSRFIPGAMLLGLTGYVFAATEYEETVPLELVKILLSNRDFGEVRVYSDILEQFPDLDLPAQFEVLGSVDQGYTMRVVLKTSLESETASQALEAELEQQGFIPYVIPGIDQFNRGFIVPRQMQRPTLLCRDDVGNMSISVSRVDDNAIISLGISQTQDMLSQTCAQRIEEQSQNYAMMQNARNRGVSGLRQYLPRMEIPADDTPARLEFVGGASSSGSSNALETEYELNIDWSISDVYQYLADQISEQGWELDNESIGDISANGDWTSSPGPDVELIGNLNILQTGNGNYQLKFRLVLLGNLPNQAQPYSPFRIQN